MVSSELKQELCEKRNIVKRVGVGYPRLCSSTIVAVTWESRRLKKIGRWVRVGHLHCEVAGGSMPRLGPALLHGKCPYAV